MKTCPSHFLNLKSIECFHSPQATDANKNREEPPIARRKKSAELLAEEEEKYLTTLAPAEEDQVDKAALERIRAEMKRQREASKNSATEAPVASPHKRMFPEDFSGEDEEVAAERKDEKIPAEPAEEERKKKKVEIEIVFSPKWGSI